MTDQVVGGQKLGRNEPCPCGSGRKWKNCHGSAEKHTLAMAVAKEAYMKEMERLVAEDIAARASSTVGIDCSKPTVRDTVDCTPNKESE